MLYASTTVMKTRKLINYFIFKINDITYLLCSYRQIKIHILYWGTLGIAFKIGIPDIGT